MVPHDNFEEEPTGRNTKKGGDGGKIEWKLRLIPGLCLEDRMN